MHYPDGSEIRVGDAVLLHHRTYTGVVQHIIMTPDEIASWDLKEPGLMIDTSYGGLVFQPLSSLNDEEVLPASPLGV